MFAYKETFSIVLIKAGVQGHLALHKKAVCVADIAN